MEQILIDLNNFKEFMKERGFDFLVVGSLALRVHGIELRNKPGDIDIEVIDSEQANLVFKSITDSQGNTYYQKKEDYPEVGWSHKPYIFNFGNTKVNVWMVEKFTHETFVYKDYVKYAGVMSILKAKMAYKRSKDYQDMNYLIKSLLSL